MKQQSSLRTFLLSNAGKRFFNIFYSWGAAVVIIGAMLKILHLPWGNGMLMIGMITEALVFFISGFDDDQAGVSSDEEVYHGGGQQVVGVMGGGTGVGSTHPTGNIDSIPTLGGTGIAPQGGGGTTVILGGGGSAGGFSQGGSGAGGTGGTTGGSLSNGNQQSSGFSTASPHGGSSTDITPEYAEKVSAAADKVEDFTNTMNSLNEVSTSLLSAYKQIMDSSFGVSENSRGFSDNMRNLNQNMMVLNQVYEGQLHSIKDQMETVKYMSDSLQRIKGLYDGAITDSDAFKRETEKMTKQIQALNEVYARLLIAMTSNPNPPII